MPFPDLPAPLSEALAERGYAEPTAVQRAVLEAETAGHDLLVSAQTGSGKTVAYGLAMASDLLGEDGRLERPQDGRGAPLALVIAPTRELALQVREELGWLYARAGGRVVSCVGGMDPVAERRQLAAGAQLVVGTPGRLRDHIERGNLRTGSLKVVVLDEADEMLDLGFREELEAILDEVPAERRTLLFSATVPKAIATLAATYQRDAVRIAATAEGGRHSDITYRAMPIAPRETERAVVNVLREVDARAAMVFCTTRAAVARLHGNLLERGFAAVALSGELSQAERSRAIQGLRDGRARVCVATDVAARGIDLPDLGLVIHAELPKDPETLQHRSGRTGRAGRKGVSVLLVPYNKRRLAERLLQAARVQAEWGPPPSAEGVRARDNERLAAQAAELVQAEGVEDDLALGRTLLESQSPEAVAAALIRVLRAPLPAPEELEEPQPDRGSRPMRSEGRSEGRDGPREAGAWFRMNVGRNGNADPRWLLPFLCRRGHVTRQEIGRIQIGDRETRFEVASYAAARFVAAAAKPDKEDAHIRIEATDGPARYEGGGEGRGPARPRGYNRGPAGPAPHTSKRQAEKGRPARGRPEGGDARRRRPG